MFAHTRAEISLDAIAANLAGVRELAGDRLVLAAVKANAYGHGAVPVSAMIQRTGSADWLGVATVGEGIELRDAGVRLPILKLSHALGPDQIEAALRRQITLAVVDADTIDSVGSVARGLGVRVPVHLKIDTGMRRIGSEPDVAADLVARVDADPNLRLQGIFTHPPVADMSSGVDFTRAEFASFQAMVAGIQAHRGPVELVHAANSGAILGHDLGATTLVRPGIMVYGYYPDASTPRRVRLRPALRLVSAVSFIKKIRAGQTVGYGRTWTAPRDTWIGTVPIGYGDGYSRLNSNRGRVLIGGVGYPIAGRVCMDQTMIDLGPDEPVVRVGDEVVLLGRSGDEQIDADDLAALMGTISYEVTCLFTPRVARVYRE